MAIHAPAASTRSPSATWSGALAGTALWCVLVGVAIVWGFALVADRPEMRVSAAPFVGTWERSVADEGALWRAVLIGAVAVAGAPAVARRLPWRAVVAAAALLGVMWVVALNAVDGPEARRGPLTSRYEYVAGISDVDAAGGVAPYLDTFTDRISDYPTHVRGHPPGLVVVLSVADRVGLDPVDTALGLVLAGWGIAISSALVATRHVAGEAGARRVAPLLALAPAAVWAGTSADAFFAGVVGAAVAALVVATGADEHRSDGFAAVGGLLVGASLLLSYATVPVLAIPVVVALVRRRVRPLAIGAAVAATTLVVAGLTGFWWPAGLLATRDEYHAGLASVRPFGYFAVGNLAAVAVAVGPALGGGIAGLARRLGPGALAVGALIGVAMADGSGFSKGETERIWLVFVPWLATAAAFLPGRPDQVGRVWVAGHVALGLGLQAGLRTPW